MGTSGLGLFNHTPARVTAAGEAALTTGHGVPKETQRLDNAALRFAFAH